MPAEYLLADPNYVAHIPAGLAADQAAGGLGLQLAAEGKVKADIELSTLPAINSVLKRLEHGDVASRGSKLLTTYASITSSTISTDAD